MLLLHWLHEKFISRERRGNLAGEMRESVCNGVDWHLVTGKSGWVQSLGGAGWGAVCYVPLLHTEISRVECLCSMCLPPENASFSFPKASFL